MWARLGLHSEGLHDVRRPHINHRLTYIKTSCLFSFVVYLLAFSIMNQQTNQQMNEKALTGDTNTAHWL